MSILSYKDSNSNTLVPLTGYLSDSFYITHEQNGLDTLTFFVDTNSPIYQNLVEETVVEYENNDYVIKKIQDDKFEAKLNLEFLKSNLHYNEEKTQSLLLVEQLINILGEEWTIEFFNCSSVIKRTLDIKNNTDYDIIMKLMSTYSVYFQWETLNKKIIVHSQKNEEASGKYLTTELNLRSISFQGDTTELVTVIYPEGKDELRVKGAKVTEEMINKYGLVKGFHYNDNNDYLLDYVTCFEYTDKRICSAWKDERYTIKENLLEDSLNKVFEYGLPVRSYECDVINLAKQGEKYEFLSIRLHAVLTLIDNSRGLNVEHRIVQYVEYPDNHALDKVVLSRVPSNISYSIQQISSNAEDYTDKTKTALEQAIIKATSLISGNEGGYVVIHDSNEDELPDEILIMDKQDINAAEKIWRWNKNGLGYSKTGYYGPYSTAITADGQIVADFITAGVINGQLIEAGTVKAEAISLEYRQTVAEGINEVQQNLTVAEGELKSEISKKVENDELSSKIEQNYDSVRISWNKSSRYIEFKDSDINIYTKSSKSDNDLLCKMTYSGMWYYYSGTTIGKIGTNAWNGDETFRGLTFDLENKANYMCWCARNNPTDSYYDVKLIYYHDNKKDKKGIHFSCDTYTDGNLYLNDTYKINRLTNGSVCYTGPFVFGVKTGDNYFTNYFKFSGSSFAAYNNSTINFYTSLNMNGFPINNASDLRLKENVENTQISGLSVLNAIELKQFKWIDSINNGDFVPIGIIAQQLEKVAPELISKIKVENTNDNVLNIKISELVFYCIKAIQELTELLVPTQYDKATYDKNLEGKGIHHYSDDIAPVGSNQNLIEEETKNLSIPI